MTTLLTWQEQEIPVFPWDTTENIIQRIAEKEKVSAAYLDVKEDFGKLIRNLGWDEKDVAVPIDVRNLAKEWKGADIITTMKDLSKDEQSLYVRLKTEKGEIDEQLWDTLFRHEFDDKSFQEWRDELKKLRSEENHKRKFASNVSKLYQELSTEEPKELLGWKSEKHRVLIQVEDVRSLASLFASVSLEKEWKLAIFYQNMYQWGEKKQWIVKMQRMKDPNMDTLLKEIEENKLHMEEGIYLYHETTETPVRIQASKEQTKGLYEIELEIDNDHPDLVEKLLEALSISTIKKQTDVGMVGSFVFPQLYMDISILQDMCMNDPVISHFFYVNELKKATYDNAIGVSLRQDIKDVLGMETLKNYDFFIKNSHRQSGFQVNITLYTPISEKYLALFFLLMRQLIGRYLRRREEFVEDYVHFIPDFKKKLESLQKSIVKNIKTSRPEYIAKYPRMFVRNLYSVICQKNLQPILIKEEDTYNVPKESFIQFPPEPIAEINPEYYYCPNKDYPYAGLKEMDLKGKDIFINLAPCCFNSPQDKENEKKISKLRTKDDDDEIEKEKTVSKTNIISGKFLIKYPGQLGTIRPPSMNRFFMAYDPFAEYFRVGVEQSSSSLIACMLMRRQMMGIETPYDTNDVRMKISQDVDCVNACLQENPGLNAEEIKSDMANPNVYFDPRRFYRAVELYFGVRLLVFSKEQEIAEEDANLLLPFSMRTHYTNHSDLPFTIVFEHWGGKTNILSKFKHPHCELVGFKTFTESTMRFEFSPKGIFQLLEYVLYPFDGNHHIQPFYRKECWFFRHLIGQTTDPLGKVRWLHFQYYNHNFYAEIDPPIAIQDDVVIGDLPDEIPVVNARLLLKFLNKFDRWQTVHVPNPEDGVVYWTVSQNHVLWKSLEENSHLRLSFICRLETPQPNNIRNCEKRLQQYIKTEVPDLMIYKPPQWTPSVHHDAKIVNLLCQLCVSGFSFFLHENNVRQGATDMDVVINTFFEQKTKIDSSFVYPRSIDYHAKDFQGFISGKRIVVPSQHFMEKLKFHLKWLLFYQPQYVFDSEKTIVNPFEEIADFTAADPQHYYCDLSEVQNVLKYSIEDLYEISSVVITELSDVCKKRNHLYVLWYNQDQSPYSHPSIVVLYKTLDKTKEAVQIWREEHKIMTDAMLSQTENITEPPSIYDFSFEENIWKKPSMVDRKMEKMFRVQAKDNEYLLFFPVQ